MNFREAIDNLKLGSPIRRMSWPYEMAVINNDGIFILVVEFVEWFNYSPSVEDVKGEDWMTI